MGQSGVKETEMDDDLRKRLLAIEVLLQEPEDISDALETELYTLRDKLQAVALSYHYSLRGRRLRLPAGSTFRAFRARTWSAGM